MIYFIYKISFIRSTLQLDLYFKAYLSKYVDKPCIHNQYTII